MWYTSANNKRDIKQKLESMKHFIKNLEHWTGKKITSAFDMYSIYTSLECQKYMNLTLPSWTTGVYPDGDLLKGSLLFDKVMNYNSKMIKKTGGRYKKYIGSVPSNHTKCQNLIL